MNPQRVLIEDVLSFSLKEYRDIGYLTPVTSRVDVPFDIKRLFYVHNVQDKAVRGCHAHKECSQVLIAVVGSVTVTVMDGLGGSKQVTLKAPSEALLIPAGIWAQEEYHTVATTLLVLCSHDYDPNDYINTDEEFRIWKNQ